MIKKINIASFGQYQDYKWDSIDDLSEKTLQRLNIIYGRNYSGKTTLSRIFSCIEQEKMIERYEEAQFSFEMSDSSTVVHNNLTTAYKFRVYNSDFMMNNLSFFFDERGSIKPFTLIGSTNVEVQGEIDIIDQELGNEDTPQSKRGILKEIQTNLLSFEKEKSTIEKGLSEDLTTEANRKIKTNPHYWGQNSGTYNRSNIEREIDEILKNPPAEISADQEAKLKQEIDELVKLPLSILPESSPKLNVIIDESKNLVTQKINSNKLIEALLGDPDLNFWIETGYHLHQEEHQTCKFCNNTISSSRWEALKDHFNKEMEELKEAIDKQLEALEKSKGALANFFENKGIIAPAFYHSLQEEYKDVIAQWDTAKTAYTDVIKEIESRLEHRKSNIFDILEWIEVEDPSVKILEAIKSANNLINKNNSYTEDLSRKKEEYRKKLRLYRIHTFIQDIRYSEEKTKISNLNKKISQHIEDRDKLQNEINELTVKRGELELKLKDEGKAADAINHYLAQFFGSHHLQLEPEVESCDDVKRTVFRVKRGEELAFNLSGGEASLIAFCYFIAQLKDELSGPDAEKLIIYIDDPISSLDANHIFYVYSLIESILCEPLKYAQLFISTHNLEFLKYLKRLTAPPIPEKNGAVSRLDLCIYREEKPGEKSRSVLRLMPRSLSEHITEYDFLFKEIYSVIKPLKGDRHKYIENNYTQFYNLPNNMRKFLECYFSYRRPDVTNPLCAETLKELLGNTPWPKMINRIINEGSHLAWAEKGAMLLDDVQEAEKGAVLILKAIRSKDRVHFDALCKVCQIDLVEDKIEL